MPFLYVFEEEVSVILTRHAVQIYSLYQRACLYLPCLFVRSKFSLSKQGQDLLTK